MLCIHCEGCLLAQSLSVLVLFAHNAAPSFLQFENTQPQLLRTHCIASLYTAASYVDAASTQPQLLCTCKQKQAKASKCKQQQTKASKSKQKQKQPKATKSKQKQSKAIKSKQKQSKASKSKAEDCIHTPKCSLAKPMIAYAPPTAL